MSSSPIIQSFLKIPALKDLAPTQTEPPFKITQLTVLTLFRPIDYCCSHQVPATNRPA